MINIYFGANESERERERAKSNKQPTASVDGNDISINYMHKKL